MVLSGCFRLLFLYDVAEAFDLKTMEALLGPRGGRVKHLFPRRTPEYVRFEQAPIAEQSEQVTLPAGTRAVCSVKYYEFAAVVVQFELPFECDWRELASRASRWMDDAEVEQQARQIARKHLEVLAGGVLRPNPEWLQEDYIVVNLREVRQDNGETLTAAQLLADYGQQIAEILLGESTSLARNLVDGMLESSISYYPSDLVVVGASAAFVYDGTADAESTEQVLEYAKTQLLEFRYYDGLMTRLLSSVYDVLETKKNILFQRWSFPRQAERIDQLRLDVMELTERIDNAIKFIGDVYYARLYRLAASRIGLSDYRSLVDEKLKTVGELYDYMADQFGEARSFVLEVAVGILALLDVILLFRGK